jgi:hypothetical protein
VRKGLGGVRGPVNFQPATLVPHPGSIRLAERAEGPAGVLQRGAIWTPAPIPLPVIEGSIEHRIALMSREERLARVEELLEGAS